MNVLVITASFDEASGIGRYSKAVVVELRLQGETVRTILTVQPKLSDVPLVAKEDYFALLRNIWRVRRAAKTAQIVHVFDAWPFSIYALAAVLGTRKVLFINGVGTYSVPPRQLSLKRIVMLIAYARAKHIFSISAFTQKMILGRLPFEKSASVVHLATTPLPKPQKKRIEYLVARYEIPSNAKIVLTVGAIKDRKGQSETFQGVLLARQKVPELMYVMVGDKRDRAYVSSVQKRALNQGGRHCSYRIVADAYSDEDLSAWYSLADIFALNSNNTKDHFEGFGLVFLEAAQFGVPCIGSLGCGIEDAIENRITGMLVPQRDTMAIASAIESILKQRESMSSAAINFAKRFSWRSTVEAYRKIYYTYGA